VNQFPKTLLLLMTFSVFFALLQVLLRAETKKSDKTSIPIMVPIHKETIRKESEPIPMFVKRYQLQSFDLWEKSYIKKNTKINKNESTKINQK
jgi:hypothetical protein